MHKRIKPRNPMVREMLGRNRTHKDRKRALKSERISNAALWRMLNTGV